MRNRLAILGLACAALVATGASCTSTKNPPATKSHELTVVGLGTVPLPNTPRALILNFLLNGSGRTVLTIKQTTTLATTVFDAVLDTIEGAGAAADDISRQGQHIDFSEFGVPTASDQVRVNISSADQASTYLEAAYSRVRLGFRSCRTLHVECSTALRSTSFDTVAGDSSSLLAAARTAALADAKARATALARAAGVTLGDIQSIDEGGDPERPPTPPQQNVFNYTVTVSYALR